MSELTQEDQHILRRTNNVRRLVRSLEAALTGLGYGMQLEHQELMEVLAALDLVYDGRARILKMQDEIDDVCMSARTLAGAVSHVSRVCIGEKDPGTVEEPESVMSPAGVIRL